YNEISDEIVYKGDFTDIIFTFVEKHFAGYGNGDVYADYKSGDKFLIIMGPLASSGFSDILPGKGTNQKI
ncbi:MAG: hypothetical protein II868_03585, partial [Butyrivibrio sp.]|nr:hypothetical protein [Butyrivibrio sp.]